MTPDSYIEGNGEEYLRVLKQIIGGMEGGLGGETCLDLCCGEMTHTRQINWIEHVGVDVIDWPNRPAGPLFILADVRKWRPDQTYDVVLCSDGIEHLTKSDGLALLENMAHWGRTQIIFTPSGPCHLHPDATDPHEHKSAWTADEFVELGWQARDYPYWHKTLNLGAFFAWNYL